MNDYYEENNTSSLRALHNPSLNKLSEDNNKEDDENLADVESQRAPLLIILRKTHQPFGAQELLFSSENYSIPPQQILPICKLLRFIQRHFVTRGRGFCFLEQCY